MERVSLMRDEGKERKGQRKGKIMKERGMRVEKERVRSGWEGRGGEVWTGKRVRKGKKGR